MESSYLAYVGTGGGAKVNKSQKLTYILTTVLFTNFQNFIKIKA